MLAEINPVALPALRIAATLFLIINLLGGAYIFRNRHRFFRERFKCRRRHSRRSQIEGRGRSGPVVCSNHVSCDSAHLSLERISRIP
jgi:hypothetical protein